LKELNQQLDFGWSQKYDALQKELTQWNKAQNKELTTAHENELKQLKDQFKDDIQAIDEAFKTKAMEDSENIQRLSR